MVENAAKFYEELKNIYLLSGDDHKVPNLKKVVIMHHGSNYLQKMKTDTLFLGSSELNKWFNFSRKPDPFLICPSSSYASTKGVSKYFLFILNRLRQISALKKTKMSSVPIQPPILKRIKAAELILESSCSGNGENERSKSISSRRSATNSECRKPENLKDTLEINPSKNMNNKSSAQLLVNPMHEPTKYEKISEPVMSPLGIPEVLKFDSKTRLYTY